VLGIIRRNGAFAEYLTLHAENLHVLPDTIPDEEAVFIEPLAAALEIQEQIAISPEDRVLVLGDGKLGQLVARTLALTGCRLVVAGRHRSKLALLEWLGVATLREDEIPQRHFDIAVECSGNAAGFDLARDSLRARGTLVMKSTYAGDLTVNASSIVVDELTLVGSRCGPFAPAIELLAGGEIDVRPLIAASFPLEQAIDAFAAAKTPGTLKVIISPSS
jgi:threonine dehydrogenase-like Zn-dependent dehydrogenase